MRSEIRRVIKFYDVDSPLLSMLLIYNSDDDDEIESAGRTRHSIKTMIYIFVFALQL